MTDGSRFAVLLLILVAWTGGLGAQGRPADYERAAGLRARYLAAVENLPERASWIKDAPRFWYRKSVPGGHVFVLVDAEKLSRQAAFDHDKLAAVLNEKLKSDFSGKTLPFNRINFVENENGLEFEAGEKKWRCRLEDYSLQEVGPASRRGDGWQRHGAPPAQAASVESKASPDGKWLAFIENYNLFFKSSAEQAEKFALSHDGSEGNFYDYLSLAWSPDSKKIAIHRVKPGFQRQVLYVESSPPDRLQPRLKTLDYTKPGDRIDLQQPVLFELDGSRSPEIDNELFANPFILSNPVWRSDGSAFTFEYNQRGHQVFRVIEVEAENGRARALISEETETFFDYSGKRFRHDCRNGSEIIWMSERDGWNHLYLYDTASGTVKNRITGGPWAVRGVERVDEEKRQVWFLAGGLDPQVDPYFLHLYRVDFDGGNLTALTSGNANHQVSLADDLSCFVDTWSRVDLAPTMQLKSTADGRILMELEKVDDRKLRRAGWKPPEAFKAKGRDGSTDIWGLIIRPTNFKPEKRYPVIENIYAGPHSAHVPKSFLPYHGMMALAELGFIVVQIDGMGTSHRSKAFHDYCWQNLADAGFPDRIPWHRAAARKYSYYDISRVGIYGTSAGGQNALGGLLFHPEFYQAAYAANGCHDNRMDKIWWNEQWMGWPIGPHYAASSNVDNAWRLQGKLLLVVGEMDTNVDPASTMQVVDALIKAGKYFDLLVIPGANHGSGGEYGERKRDDFFVRHLLGVETPDRNRNKSREPGKDRK